MFFSLSLKISENHITTQKRSITEVANAGRGVKMEPLTIHSLFQTDPF